jgi:hypothetical protein
VTKPQLRHWAALALVLALSIAVWTYTRERHDLPPFDHAKAVDLSDEKRAGYERMLFNELAFGWNRETARFTGDDATQRREAAWLAAANDGYELAHLALQVAQPSNGRKYHTEKPLRRLEELIAQGDAGAMCMWLPLSLLIARSDDEHDTKYRPIGIEYARMGLRRHHPRCMVLVGWAMLAGSDGFARDVEILEIDWIGRPLPGLPVSGPKSDPTLRPADTPAGVASNADVLLAPPKVQGEYIDDGTEDVLLRFPQERLLANDTTGNAGATLRIVDVFDARHGQVYLVHGVDAQGRPTVEVVFVPEPRPTSSPTTTTWTTPGLSCAS